MRYILCFKTELEEISEYVHPKGFSIIQVLEKELRNAGIYVHSPENYRDMAWSLDCVINQKNFFFFVGFLGAKESDWQIVICSGISLIGRLLGRSDDQERMELAKAIQEILLKDNRFLDLKWYPKYTGGPKDVWHSDPAVLHKNLSDITNQ